MTTNEIRTKFLDFFKSKGSSIIASDSLVPKDDPTVLFTTAGMQQFKPQFLGHIDGFTKAATCQKCLRTDDLDVVGKTDFHHTFFEMLGNFSFGDYFKKEAIHWAWEFLTKELGIKKDDLWVSVYKDDEEAYNVWLNEIKVPANKIVKLGDKSNFWPSNARLNGPNGPCGPCSEIFYDYGVNPNCLKGKDCNPDCSCGRFSEVWNLVFTQFNRKDGGVLEPLPAKNIDTGMGLERLAAVVQGKKSNYETDNFAAILKVIKDTFTANKAKATESEFRIIADHMRAVTIGIADGVMPSNEGRGYVMRKLIADVTNIILLAHIERPLAYSFVHSIIEVMQEPYPELMKKEQDIILTVKMVEEAVIKSHKKTVPEFKSELKKKFVIPRIDFKKPQMLSVVTDLDEKTIEDLGKFMFYYRDTKGLPMEFIIDQVKAHLFSENIIVKAMDEAKARLFSENIVVKTSEITERLMEEQRNRSRAGSKMTGEVYANQDFTLNLPKTEFLGYQKTKAVAQVLKVTPKEDRTFQIILDKTPFYAESGGQVGDKGTLMGPDGQMHVEDTRKINDIYVHYGVIEGKISEGQTVQAVINEPRRKAIMRNHTATHLLQAALRETLGTHIKQQGSLVDNERLRFDFTHPMGIKPEELKKIENRLNEFISRADNVTTEVLALEEAKKKGALAFFAEKYGQTVRVVSIGDYSREFCGGTHVSSTGEIEAIKIVSEGSVAQGIRRVEAVTGKAKVEEILKKKQHESAAIEEAQRMKVLEKEKQNIYFDKLKSSVDEMIAAGENIKGASLIIRSLENIDIALLRKLSDLLKQKVKSGIFILGAKGPQDASVILSVTDDLVARGIKANELMQEIGVLLGGSGGGRENLAQAGSKQPQKLDGALAKAKEIVSVAMAQKA